MDISTLGIKIDTAEVAEANKLLSELSKKGSDAQKSSQELVNQHRVQAATLKMTSAEVERFKLALGGATDSQIAQVKAAQDAIAAHEKQEKKLKDIRHAAYDFTSGMKVAFAEAFTAASGFIVGLDLLIKKTGELADVNDKTFAPIEGLVQMKTAADVAGVSMMSVGDAMNMMQKQMARGSDESKGAARGLKAIGIEIEDFRKLDPAAQFEQLAMKMALVENNGGKVAVIQDIIGRGGAAMLPFLKEFADQQNRNTVLTVEAVVAADNYADSQARAKSQLSQYLGVMSATAAPVMTAFTKTITDTIKAFFGLNDITSDLGSNTKVKEFAEGAGMFLAHVADIAVTVASRVQILGHGLASLAAAVAVIVNTDLTDQKAIGAIPTKIKDIYGAYAEEVKKANSLPSFADTFKKNLAEMNRELTAEERKMQARAESLKASATRDLGDYKTSDGKAAKKEKEDPTIAETTRYLDAINKRKLADEGYLATGQKISDFEKYEIDVITSVYSAKSKLNDAQKAAIMIALGEAAATNALVQARKDHDAGVKQQLEAQKSWDAELEKNEELLIKQRRAVQDATQTLREANGDAERLNGAEAASIGATDKERKIAIATIQNEIKWRQELKKIDDTTYNTQDERNAAVAEAQAQSARRLNNELTKIETEGARERFEASNTIAHQFFTDLFNDGTSAFRNLGKSLKSLLIDALYQLTVKKWVIQIAASVTGEGGVAGAAASALGGGGGGLGSAFSSLSGISSLLGGAASAFGAGTATGFSALLGGYGGGALSAGASMIAGGGSVMGGLGMIAGTLGPIALGVYGLYKIFGKAGGGPQVGGNVGMVGNGVAPEDRSMNSMLKQNLDQANKTFDNLMKQLGGINPGISFGQSTSADPRGTSNSSVATQVLRNGQVQSQQTAWQTVGRSDEAMQAEMQRQLTEAMISAVQSSNIDREILDYFNTISAGLDTAGRASALQMLPQIAALKNAFDGLSSVFPQITSLSLQAKIGMANMAGGIDQLAGLLNGFMNNFFSAGERLNIAGNQLQTALNKIGVSMNVNTASMADYRNMVMGINTATTEGQAAFVAALQASQAFADVKREQQAALDKAKADWEQQQAQARADYERRVSEYESRLSEAQSNLTAAYNAQRGEITKTIDSLENWKDSLASLRDDLNLDQSLSPLTPLQQYEAARQKFAQVAAGAESGDPRAQSDFDSAARQLLQLSRQVNASGTGYAQDFAMVGATLSQLEAAASSQISDAQRQLQYLDASVQVLININTGVKNVADAIFALRQVMAQKPAETLFPSAPTNYNIGISQPAYGGNVVVGGSGFAGTLASTPFRDVINTATIAPVTTPSPAGAGGSGLVWMGPSSEMDGGWVNADGTRPQSWGSELAGGIERVPYDRYRATLHRDEAVVPAPQADFFRSGSQGLVAQVVRLTAEVQSLRRENREDAGASIGATFDAANVSAEKQADATIRAARQRSYQAKNRPVLS